MILSDYRVTLIDFGGSEQRPGTSANDVGTPGSPGIIEDFDVPPPPVSIQPQGTTKRPQLPSLEDLPSTTPRPSPLLSRPFRTVPGTNQGNQIKGTLLAWRLPSYQKQGVIYAEKIL